MINRSKKIQLKKLNKNDKTTIYKIPINNSNVSGSNFRMIVTLFRTIVTSDYIGGSREGGGGGGKYVAGG